MKSQVKLLVHIMDSLVHDWHCAISSRDVSELEKRASSEGFNFLASVLPTLDDTLLLGLSSGKLSSNRQFTARPGDLRPKFLHGLWSKVFEADGSLVPSPCSRSIFAIRQISRTFKKVFEVCSDDKVEAQISLFKETDGSLPDTLDDPALGRVNAILHGHMLFSVSSTEDWRMAHGPGAVAERLDSVARWDFPAVSEAIAARFDMSDFYPTYYEDWPCDVLPELEGRVVAVPKTHDKPRLISIEPTAAIYAQKGIERELSRRMRLIPQINLLDQTRNRSLALLGSRDGGLSTIDLSEASDRVSLSLLGQVFRLTPGFLDLIMAVRTPVVDTGSGKLRLRKFASMGCALTFPVQMLVFRTIVVAAMCEQDGDLSLTNVRRHGRRHDVGVYGDDIIVPTHYAQSVMRKLEDCALRVNVAKSFCSGLFRESCGGDYYAGWSVTPIYVRRNHPQSRRDVDSIVSYAATSHLFSEVGLDRAAQHLSNVVQDLVGPAPIGAGAVSVSHPRVSRTRYNTRLQRHEVLACVQIPKRKRTSASDSAVLSAALHYIGSAVIDPLRLTHHGRPTSAFITRRWVPQQ